MRRFEREKGGRKLFVEKQKGRQRGMWSGLKQWNKLYMIAHHNTKPNASPPQKRCRNFLPSAFLSSLPSLHSISTNQKSANAIQTSKQIYLLLSANTHATLFWPTVSFIVAGVWLVLDTKAIYLNYFIITARLVWLLEEFKRMPFLSVFFFSCFGFLEVYAQSWNLGSYQHFSERWTDMKIPTVVESSRPWPACTMYVTQKHFIKVMQAISVVPSPPLLEFNFILAFSQLLFVLF